MLNTIWLLIISNIFMTFAWYGHLRKHQASPLWMVILVSWAIAFFEYCFQVPANRLGAKSGLGTAHLKTIQEIITLAVFCAPSSSVTVSETLCSDGPSLIPSACN